MSFIISKELHEFLEEEKQMLKDNIEDCEDRIKRNAGNKQKHKENIELFRKLIRELNDLSPTKRQ